jgi:hypothetical protein
MSGDNGSFAETSVGGSGGFVEKGFDEAGVHRRADRTKPTPKCLAAAFMVMMMMMTMMMMHLLRNRNE